jgi:hypothetical protein
MTGEPGAKGLHARPLTGVVKDKTCLVSGNGNVTNYSPGWAST